MENKFKKMNLLFCMILISVTLMYILFQKKDIPTDSKQTPKAIKYISIDDKVYIKYNWIKEKVEVSNDLKVIFMNLLNSPPNAEAIDEYLLLDSRKYLLTANEKFIIDDEGLNLCNDRGWRFWKFDNIDLKTDKIMGVESVNKIVVPVQSK